MRMISWNVNGLRAVLKKGFEDIVCQFDADVVALQETKLQAGQATLDLPQYREFWSYAEKKGYSGTAVFTKEEPLQVLHGLGFPHLDNEGRIVACEFPEYWFVCVYTPNAQNELARINHRMEWDDAFRDFCKGLEEGVLPAGVPVERAGADGNVVLRPEAGRGEGKNGADVIPESAPMGDGHLPTQWLPLTQPGESVQPKPVVVCGDFNVAHNEIDLKNPGPNRGNAGFSDEEREKFTKLLDAGFVDTFRSTHPDLAGAYSWWSYRFNARKNNAGWRIDYFLVSDALAPRIQAASIYNEVFGSDHCPVGLELDLD
ncbi:exodeoxyribonuclease III [Senegalimassilia anaerobia]|uniref:exodeoxyribonuclease III n=1 Tax=Senegalimassilia anaerobia TaxID=1473216 RepID=UPI002E794129|nr:exodeoxyribonuclease III [Senegalimassilia anaerobia]MEE0225395.1 exodeoxyribonuclease III [Senegalimassilia anaerobia]